LRLTLQRWNDGQHTGADAESNTCGGQNVSPGRSL
jgi:hypothetical protein